MIWSHGSCIWKPSSSFVGSQETTPDTFTSLKYCILFPPHWLMELLGDLLSKNKYGALKERLLRLYQLSVAERANRLLSLDGSGDCKPSELMENILALIGSRDLSFFFTHLFQVSAPITHSHCDGQLPSDPDKRLSCTGWGLQTGFCCFLDTTVGMLFYLVWLNRALRLLMFFALAAVMERQKKERVFCFYHCRFWVC